jgi:hypothetical protein
LRAETIEVVFPLLAGAGDLPGWLDQYLVALVAEQITADLVEGVNALLDIFRKANQLADSG